MARRADRIRPALSCVFYLVSRMPAAGFKVRQSRECDGRDSRTSLRRKQHPHALDRFSFPRSRHYRKTLDRGIDPANFKGAAITYPSHMARRVRGGEHSSIREESSFFLSAVLQFELFPSYPPNPRFPFRNGAINEVGVNHTASNASFHAHVNSIYFRCRLNICTRV